MNTILPKHNIQLNAVKAALREIVLTRVSVSGEFIANTPQSKDYLAFVRLSNIEGIENSEVVMDNGFDELELSNVGYCIDSIIADLKRKKLLLNLIFISNKV